jgi:transposase-like protein
MSEFEDAVRRGRPPKGSSLVEGLDGSEHARERLRLILDSLAGKISVEEACRRLDISEARFHSMRNEVLQAGISRLEPGAAGRPPKQTESETSEAALLREEVRQLRIDLAASQLREELAIAMPAHFSAKKAREAALKKTCRPPAPPAGPKSPEEKLP